MPERRAALLAAGLTGVAAMASLAGCAALSEGQAAVSVQPMHWRTLQGGFLPRMVAGAVGVASPSNGMFVRWMTPSAVALRGADLLVADAGTGRLWRADVASSAIVEVAGVPVGVGMSMDLGPDLSVWVLDPSTRQVLCFARDGRLLHSRSIDTGIGSPVALALADGGNTLIVADGALAQWSEQRGTGELLRSVAPQLASGQRITGVDALALGRDSVFVLDRLAGAVHRVSRRGAVLKTFGQGELKRPLAIAVDRKDRVYVHDAQDDSVKRLAAGVPTRRWTAADLGVQQIGGLAVDGPMLAVTDALAGTAVLHSFSNEASI